MGLVPLLPLCILNIYLVSQFGNWNPEAFAYKAIELATEEINASACTRIQAAVLNLKDHIQFSTGNEILQYEFAVQKFIELANISMPIKELRNTNTCLLIRADKAFESNPYRLNGKDQPQRRFNWSARFEKRTGPE